MKALVITGPTGVGKNTIADIYAKRYGNVAVIDTDLIRIMPKPDKAPWEGEEGTRQYRLGAINAASLAKNFLQAGYDVLILDVATNEVAQIYRERLKVESAEIVLLLPTYDEIVRRNKTRPPRLTDDEIKMVYSWQQDLMEYDVKIDTTSLSADETADKLKQLMASWSKRKSAR